MLVYNRYCRIIATMRRKIMGIYCFFAKRLLTLHSQLRKSNGKMPEWPNGAVSKTVIQVTVSRVRIPVFPQPSLDFNQLQAIGTELGTKGNTLSLFFVEQGHGFAD